MNPSVRLLGVYFCLLKAHLESCPLKVVSCTNANCNEAMTRNNLQAHVTTTCPWRILQCIHCSVSHPACKTEVKVFHLCILLVLVVAVAVAVAVDFSCSIAVAVVVFCHLS